MFLNTIPFISDFIHNEWDNLTIESRAGKRFRTINIKGPFTHFYCSSNTSDKKKPLAKNRASRKLRVQQKTEYILTGLRVVKFAHSIHNGRLWLIPGKPQVVGQSRSRDRVTRFENAELMPDVCPVILFARVLLSFYYYWFGDSSF